MANNNIPKIYLLLIPRFSIIFQLSEIAKLTQVQYICRYIILPKFVHHKLKKFCILISKNSLLLTEKYVQHYMPY